MNEANQRTTVCVKKNSRASSGIEQEVNMKGRRDFLKTGIAFLAGVGMLFDPLFSAARWAYAKARKIILPKGTKIETLISKNPKTLDARNLDVTDLKDFETMGLSDHVVTVADWRLEVTGRVKNVLSLSYSDLLALPSRERKVLLICPGFFAIHGRWKGLSMKVLLDKAGVDGGTGRVIFSGPKGSNRKVESFPVQDVTSEKVFLAYEVNGQPLPRKHGFPLRVVAEDYYGSNWVKYVDRLTVERG